MEIWKTFSPVLNWLWKNVRAKVTKFNSIAMKTSNGSDCDLTTMWFWLLISYLNLINLVITSEHYFKDWTQSKSLFFSEDCLDVFFYSNIYLCTKYFLFSKNTEQLLRFERHVFFNFILKYVPKSGSKHSTWSWMWVMKKEMNVMNS